MKFLHLMFVAFFGLALAGCATTSGRGQVDQLQMRVTELEKRIEEKDTENNKRGKPQRNSLLLTPQVLKP